MTSPVSGPSSLTPHAAAAAAALNRSSLLSSLHGHSDQTRPGPGWSAPGQATGPRLFPLPLPPHQANLWNNYRAVLDTQYSVRTGCSLITVFYDLPLAETRCPLILLSNASISCQTWAI